MFPPLLKSASCWPIEKFINTVIKSDSHIQRKLASLTNNLIEIETDSPSFNLCIVFNGSEIQLRPFSSNTLGTQCNAKIHSDAATLISLLTAPEKARPLANPKIKISGDAQLVQRAFTLMKTLDLRWDDLLAPIAGETLTHHLKTSADEFQHWSTRSAKALKNSVDDYLKEEANLLPSDYSIEEFQNRLDQLRLRIDRAVARAELLVSTARSD